MPPFEINTGFHHLAEDANCSFVIGHISLLETLVKLSGTRSVSKVLISRLCTHKCCMFSLIMITPSVMIGSEEFKEMLKARLTP